MINAESNAQIRLEPQSDYNWFSCFFDVLSDQKVGHRWVDENGNDVKISDPMAKLDVNGTYNGITITRVPVIIELMKQAQTDEDFEYIFNRELKSSSHFSGPTNLFAQHLRDIIIEKKEEYTNINKPSQRNIQIMYITDRFIQWLDDQYIKKTGTRDFNTIIKLLKFDRTGKAIPMFVKCLSNLSNDERFTKTSGKEFSAVAFVFHNTEWITSNWTDWLEIFSMSFSRERLTYKPNQLKNTADLMRIKFNYLNDLQKK